MKLINVIFFCFSFFTLNYCYCQKQHKISAFVEGEYIKTIYDKTIGNNPSGIGLGLEAYFNNPSLIQPTINLSAVTFLEDDKVLSLNANGSEIADIRSMISLYAGATIHPDQIINLSFVAGPTLINSNIYLAINPSVGFYFSKKQKTIGKISYINVFNRTHDPNKDYGSLNLSVSVSLFNK